MRSLSICLVVLAACGGGSPATTTVVTEPPPPPPATSSWNPGDPIPCTTVDDCVLVPPGHLACPGVCGFCPGAVLAPKGHPAVTCPTRAEVGPGPEPEPPHQMPNCAACQQPPAIRAACSAGICVTEPVT